MEAVASNKPMISEEQRVLMKRYGVTGALILGSLGYIAFPNLVTLPDFETPKQAAEYFEGSFMQNFSMYHYGVTAASAAAGFLAGRATAINPNYIGEGVSSFVIKTKEAVSWLRNLAKSKPAEADLINEAANVIEETKKPFLLVSGDQVVALSDVELRDRIADGETVTVYYRSTANTADMSEMVINKDGIQAQNTLRRNDDGTVQVLSTSSPEEIGDFSKRAEEEETDTPSPAAVFG